jgi:type I restriction enzyme, S subunit
VWGGSRLSQFDELPEGWYLEEIQNLCNFGPKHSKELSDDLEISFVPMPAVDDVTGTIQEHETRRLGEVKKGYTHFADGDVIFAKITPCMENGKAAVAADLINGIACGSTEFHVLRSNGSVLPDYVYRYLRQQSYRVVHFSKGQRKR